MSGGVDSSVAAAILKDQGYDVIGVFMKFWSPEEGGDGKENKCCSAEAQEDARRVATQLDIPFYVLDFREEFKKKVVDYFLKEYKAGRTPNPCVECNKWIKFGLLFEKMKELKADFIATGHYAKTKLVNSKLIRYSLIVPKDKNKDQSYFLWALDKKYLDRILFPIGDYTKKEVRAMAKKFKLPAFEKKESQEVCFVNTNIREFLSSRISANKGLIVTNKGEKIGEHDGLIHFTIGQRKGIGIGGIGPASTRQSSLGGPYYVVKKDFKKNTLIVAESKESSELDSKEMLVENVNWLVNTPKLTQKCNIKVKSMALAASGVVSSVKGDKYKIKFAKPQRAITSGQSAVFYLRDRVLGGGIII